MHAHYKFPASFMSTPLALAVSLLAASDVMAQAAPAAVPASAPSQSLETVRITGQAASLRKALDQQTQAQGILNVVHADGIGKLPDANAAEALARLPGVSVERDQGEGRFVRVRGLGADFNAVNINGAITPASEAARRAPGLDLVPSGLIRALEVDKTPAPEHEASSLGGRVSVKTLSAFDLAGRLLSVEVGSNRDQPVGVDRPRAQLTYADRFLGKTLGVALSLSRDERQFASRNVETGGAWSGEQLSSFELRDYTITRDRRGAALNLDWRPVKGTSLFLRTFSSRFDDQETRQSLKYSFATPVAAGVASDGSASRGLKHRLEHNRSTSMVLGGERHGDEWHVSGQWSVSRASEDKPMGLSSSSFKASVKGLSFTGDLQPIATPVAAVMDPSQFAFDKAKFQDSSARDRVQQARVDLARDWALGDIDGQLKFGLQASRRDKRNAQETYAPSAKALAKAPYLWSKAQLAYSAVQGPAVAPFMDQAFGPSILPAAFLQRYASLPLADFRDATDSAVNDFQLSEDTDAGYLQTRIDHGANQWVLGMRLERQSFRAVGQQSLGGTLSPLDLGTQDTHRLPAVLWRHEWNSQTQLRAALTHSVVRPSFDQLSPGSVQDGDTVTAGNPLLKPLRSRNLDLGVEQRLDRDGAWSVYAFAKRIQDFSYQTELADRSRFPTATKVVGYQNGSAARLHGLEASYTQVLRQLPGWASGLIVGVNGSWVRSRAELAGFRNGRWEVREISLPSQSDRTANLSLAWEGQQFSARLAWNHKSAYLLEVGDVFDAAKDRIVRAQGQADLSLRFSPSKALQLSADFSNLGNTPYEVVQAGRKNVQLERYGLGVKLLAKWTLQ